MVLADAKLELPAAIGGAYYRGRLQQVLNHAASKGIAVVLHILGFGYSNAILSINPNLAEGQPVVGANFTVAPDGQSLLFSPSSTATVPINGGFESYSGNTFTNWWFQDAIGVRTFVDTNVTHSGSASLRIDGGSGNARLGVKFAVQPYRQYHVRAWMRTQNFNARVNQLDIRMEDSYTFQFRNFDDYHGPFVYQPTQDWTRYDFVFNSSTSTMPNLYLGLWDNSSGSVWFDDVSVQEIALVNLLRRSGAPPELRRNASHEYLSRLGGDGTGCGPVIGLARRTGGQHGAEHSPQRAAVFLERHV